MVSFLGVCMLEEVTYHNSELMEKGFFLEFSFHSRGETTWVELTLRTDPGRFYSKELVQTSQMLPGSRYQEKRVFKDFR